MYMSNNIKKIIKATGANCLSLSANSNSWADDLNCLEPATISDDVLLRPSNDVPRFIISSTVVFMTSTVLERSSFNLAKCCEERESKYTLLVFSTKRSNFFCKWNGRSLSLLTDLKNSPWLCQNSF